MGFLKWLSFIAIFNVSLSFSTESYETTFESSTSQSAFTFEPTITDLIPESTFDYTSTDEDFASESTFDYQSTGLDSTSESTFDYQTTFDDSTIESTFDYQTIDTTGSNSDYLLLFENSDSEKSPDDYKSVLKDYASENDFQSSIKNLLYPPDDRDCPLHEHWEVCTGHCQRNCSNWSKALICPDICVQGCLCDWGFTRGPEGNCIPVSECPPIEDDEPMRINVRYKCPRNEHFSLCDGCQKNCSNYDKDIPCEKVYSPGCICDEGFVRGRFGKCIPTEKCRKPSMKSTVQSKNSRSRFCRRNQHFSACNGLPLCQKSCSNYNESTICPLVCVPGCVCDEGYVIGPTGECIPLEECPYEKKPILTQESERTNSKIMNLFFESVKQELSDLPSTVSEDAYPVTISPSEDACPDELLCNRQCRTTGHIYGMCLGIREKQCVCFE